MPTHQFAKLRIAVARLLILGAVAACLDDPVSTVVPPPPPPPPPPRGLVVSDPVFAAAAPAPASSSRGFSATGGEDESVVYVSLVRGTEPRGLTATVRALMGDSTRTTAVLDGGFDPVPLAADVGDTIEVIVRDASATAVLAARIAVARVRPPIVVRTDPPPKKRDVPLNSVMIVVFSEPIDAATLSATTVYLLEGQTSVPGRVEFADEAQLAAAFVPDAPLSPGTDYVLQVTRGITDLDGDSLEGSVTVAFTTVPPVATLTLDRDTATIVIGDTLTLHAQAADSAGNLLSDRLIAWASSDSGVTSVSAAGLVRGVAAGSAMIVAAAEGQADTAIIEVTLGGQLVFSAQPTNMGAGLRITPSVQVTVQDALGNVIADYSGNVSVAIVANSGGGILSGTTTVGAVAGVATFADLRIDAPGVRYTLVARATGLSAGTSAPFDITLGESVVGQISFTSLGSAGSQEIFVVNADGSAGRQLTDHPAKDEAATWSPDGTRLAFLSDRDRPNTGTMDVYVMKADGSDVTRLTTVGDVVLPAWSRSGARIAFHTYPEFGIYVMNADGSGLRPVTNEPGVWNAQPSWSPDGTKLAFSSDRDGNREIYVMNADGSGVTRLTNDPGNDDFPAWSPDGTKIAFDSFRDGNTNIYVMNVDGSGVTKVTDHAAEDGNASWSPDGTRIAFISLRAGAPHQVFVMNADGSGVTQVTSYPVGGYQPEWSPVSLPVASVTIAPGAATVRIQDTVRLSATPRDSNGVALLGRAVAWTSSDSSVAAVDSAGLVRGVAAGSALIVASAEGKADTATIEVATPVAQTSLEIATVSSGPNQPASYSVCIDLDCTPSFNVGPNSAVSVPVSPGTYRVWIGAGGLPCGVTGQNPRDVDVPPGATTQVLFVFTCTEYGSVLAVGVGAGASVCMDYYDPDTSVCTPSWQSQGPDLLIGWVLPGPHTVWTFGAPIESGRTIVVSPGQTTIVRFDSGGVTAPAVQLVFSAQPTITGHVLTPFTVVSAKDSLGQTATDFTGAVTLTIGANPGGASVLGTTTVAAVAGIALFPDLQLDRDGTGYTLVATADGLSNGTSAPFQVVSAASIVIVPQTIRGVVGGLVPITATVRDANGLEVRDSPVTWVASDSALVRVESNWYLGRAARAWASTPAPTTVTLTATSLNQSASATVSFDYITFDSLGEGCGLTTGGAAYCWSGNLPTLGIGSIPSTAVGLGSPLLVTGGLTFRSLGVGTYHRCGVTPGGETYCWGQNHQGQLGDGSLDTSWAPVPVAGGHLFASVSTGIEHTCGLTSGGEAYCWGANRHGQLGDGSSASRSLPVPVSSGLTFTSVSAGGGQTCGLTPGGAAYCWGRNGIGELGNGTTADSPVPVAVTGGLTFVGIVAGHEHACGLTTSGTAHCWGAGGNGQLGYGSTEYAPAPVAVTGGLTFTQLTASEWATCGLTIDRDAYCWGLSTRLVGNTMQNVAILTPERAWPGLKFVKLGAKCGIDVAGIAWCPGGRVPGQP